MKDPATRERIKKDMDDPNAATWENQWYGANGGDGVMIASVLDPALRKWEGMTLTQIGRAMGKDPRDAAIDLVVADKGETAVITAIMDEDDVRAALKHPLVGVGTDSGSKARTASWPNRNRTRARGARSRASSAATSATSTCSRSRRRSAR